MLNKTAEEHYRFFGVDYDPDLGRINLPTFGTQFLPGSPEKIRVLAHRQAARQAMEHPDDHNPHAFPRDWIAPGEFSVCPKCGGVGTLQAMPAKLRTPCASCRGEPTEADREAGIHRHCEILIITLASARRDAGIPRWFWE